MDILGHRQDPGAQPALAPRVFGIPLDLEQFPVFDVRQYPAAAVAARPGGPGGSSHDFNACRIHCDAPQSEVGFVFPAVRALAMAYFS
jgi:hypothetical protein